MVTPLLSLLLLLSSPYKTAIAKSFSPSQLLPLQRFERMIMTRHLTITEMVERARCLLTMDFCIQEHKYEQSKSNKLMEVSH
ncbi:unnamed protein product [Linum tenue]|uniref:Secreted protein n=1 Tax=Linum tenue TaxID=586396 RepID=A0AAV0RZ00_9ROSI|nr:unnamed protein product [Linum tenue]